MIRKYFRYYRENFRPRGCVVAIVDDVDETIRTGWSLFNKNHETRSFTKKMARLIAEGRAMVPFRGNGIPPVLLHLQQELYEDCVRRVERHESTHPNNNN